MIRIPSGPLTPRVAKEIEDLLNSISTQLPPNLLRLKQDQQGGFFTGEGTTEAAINKPFRAKITAVDGLYCAWTEQLPDGTTSWADKAGARTGTLTRDPAYEANGAPVSVSTIVNLRRSKYHPTYGWLYVFDLGGQTGFYAKITSNTFDATLNYSRYGYTEQSPIAEGKYVDKAGGRTGTATSSPAYERSMNKEVPLGVVVWMYGRSPVTSSSSSSSSSSSGSNIQYEFECPELAQIVRLVGNNPTLNGLYDGYLQIYDAATDAFSDGERVWVKEA